MAKTKKSTGRGSKTRRPKTPKTPRTPRGTSDAARMRKLSRELEKAQAQQQAIGSRAEQLREQMTKMRGKCPHSRLAIDPDTRNTYCRDCLDIVGISPSKMMGGGDDET